MCSAGRLTQPETMQLQGMVQDRKVMILIDSEASHNFISSQLIQILGLC